MPNKPVRFWLLGKGSEQRLGFRKLVGQRRQFFRLPETTIRCAAKYGLAAGTVDAGEQGWFFAKGGGHALRRNFRVFRCPCIDDDDD